MGQKSLGIQIASVRTENWAEQRCYFSSPYIVVNMYISLGTQTQCEPVEFPNDVFYAEYQTEFLRSFND